MRWSRTYAIVRLFGADVTSGALQTAPVELPDVQPGRFHPLQATHVHRCHGFVVQGTVGEGRHAARGAEMVRDPVRIETVGCKVGFGSRQPQLLARHEPEQVGLLTAVRTIALGDVVNLAFDFESDPSAMASAPVDHGHFSRERSIPNPGWRVQCWRGAQTKTPDEDRPAFDLRQVRSAQAGVTWSACRPFGPLVTTKLTFWPSCSDLNPVPWIARKCTNRTSPPCWLMKPKPLASLNHLTVPVLRSDMTNSS